VTIFIFVPTVLASYRRQSALLPPDLSPLLARAIHTTKANSSYRGAESRISPSINNPRRQAISFLFLKLKN
jgi:hypothetical protein